MDIYASEKVVPYVYCCTHKVTKEFYIGSRTTGNRNLPSHEDLPRYKTSSKRVKPRFHEFDWTIIAEFYNPNDAYTFEQQLIHDRIEDPLCLNEVCYYTGKLMFCSTGVSRSDEHKQRISEAHTGKVVSASSRKKMSEAHLGKTMSVEGKELRRQLKIGTTLSDEAKAKISAKKKGVPKKQDTCIHCGLTASYTNINRWHNDNCKHKQ